MSEATPTVTPKEITEISEYIKDFIDKRYPDGVSNEVRQVLSEMVMDAFFDGARWAEIQAQQESRIIGANGIEPERSVIIKPA